MKVSFLQGKENYLGDYLSEFRKVGLLSRKMSVKEILKYRKDMEEGEIIRVNIEGTCFYKILLQYEELNSYVSIMKDFRRLKNAIKGHDGIYFSEYEKIKSVIKEVQDVIEEQDDISINLDEYLDDIILVYFYAKNNVFDRIYEARYRKALSEEQLRKIRNFYAKIAENTESIDIKDITIKYNDGGDNNKNLKITSPILIKMMLYEFARKYYTYIEREEEHWENNVVFYRQYSQGGSPGYDYTEYLNLLIRVYDAVFIHNEDIYKHVKAKKRMYLLFGKLLVVAGYKKYSEDNGSYLDEADYYYKSLKIREVTDGTE